MKRKNLKIGSSGSSASFRSRRSHEYDEQSDLKGRWSLESDAVKKVLENGSEIEIE